MTYIRMTGGRDRGHVKDFPFSEAQEFLRLGQALPVNFDEADPLAFRELLGELVQAELPAVIAEERAKAAEVAPPPEASAAPAVTRMIPGWNRRKNR